MKISDIKHKVISKTIISAVLLLIMGGIVVYKSTLQQSISDDLSQIKQQTNESIQKANEYQSQVSETRKFRRVWLLVPEKQKSLSGVSVDEINGIIKTLSSKNNISSQEIKIADVPRKMQNGIFDRKTIDVFYLNASLNFKSLDDVRALKFLAELFNEMIGYVVVTNLEITKEKPYNGQDLIAISSGKTVYGINVKVDFTWYFYRSKESKETNQSSGL